MKPIDLFVIQKVIEKREARDMTQEKFNISHLNEIAKILKCSPKDFLPEDPL